jgi:hypothetical protein
MKFVKAGVMEDGQWFETKEGTPQGAVISPVLANLYLHYVLDLWVRAWRKKVAQGDMIAVRYADDAVLGFQHREEAERFLAALRERLRKFGLELHPEKTRLIEFGRYAAERRAKRGEGKSSTRTVPTTEKKAPFRCPGTRSIRSISHARFANWASATALTRRL